MTIAVFGLYVAPEHQAGNDRRYGEMRALVQQSRSHIAVKLFTADDGESVVVVEFDGLAGCGEYADHKIAQEGGESDVYASYDVAVCKVVQRHVQTAATEAL
jgi:hypothetical protein